MAAATLLSIFSSLSSAALIQFSFEFSSTSGPIQFLNNIGSFQYDDAVASVAGGQVNQDNLFTALDVSFGGFSFDEITANSGWLDFSPGGIFKEALFGNNCSGGSCALVAGQDNWWIRVGIPGSANTFNYIGFDGNDDNHTVPSATSENMLILKTVPEPGILSLLILSFLALHSLRPARVSQSQ